MGVVSIFNKWLNVYIDFVSNYPLRAWSRACLGHGICLVILGITVAVLGFPFSSEAPLYLEEHITELRMASFLETQITSTFDYATPEVQLARSVNLDEQNKELLIRFMITATGDKPLNDENVLKRIVDLDDSLRAVDGYEEHCLRQWTNDDFNIQNDESKVDEAKLLNDNYKSNSSCYPPISPLWGCAQGDTTNGCSAITAFPPGIKNCKKDSCTKTEDFEDFDYDFASMKIKQYSEAGTPPATSEMTAHQLFYMVTDSEFNDTNENLHAIMMIYQFGLPQPGYNNIMVDRSDQEDEIIDWMYDSYNDMMLDHEDDDFEFILYSMDHMLDKFIEEQLSSDAVWVSASFVFAWSYLVGMTGSFWLGTMGIGQVFLCFFSSYNIYAWVFQQDYFGVFNVLSIFIILGIGADNVFVFLDTFAYSTILHTKLNDRMMYTWKRASLQLLVTSSVAFFGFFIQFLTSSFPAIYSFGAFASSLVAMNYASVISFYPTCIAVYHTKFNESPFMFGIFSKLKSKFSKDGAGNESNEEKITEKTTDTKAELTGVQRFFHDIWFPFIMKARVVIIILCFCLIAFGIFKASELESDPEPPQFVPSDHPYQRMLTVVREEFSRGGSVMALQAHIVAGIDRDDPIDRSGIEPTDREDRGIPNFDPNFSLPKSARCIIQLCDYFEVANESLGVGGVDAMYGVSCLVKEFKKHINDETLWNSMTGINANEDLFIEKGLEWIQVPDVYSAYKQYIFADRDPEDESKPIVHMVDMELKLTETNLLPYKEGTALTERWGDLLENTIFDGSNVAFDECPAIQDHFQPFVTGDEYTWDFFFLQEALVDEAWEGIFYAMVVVFVVMLLSSMNIIVTVVGTALISSVVVCVIGFTVLNGWYLGLLESINFVIVPGFSINYVAFLCGGYLDSNYEKRTDRVRDMLTSIGSSCISGSLSTLGACFFLFFPVIVFFNKFGTFIFVTISLALIFSLGLFASLMTFIGPEGNQGDIMSWFVKKNSKQDSLPTTMKDVDTVVVKAQTPTASPEEVVAEIVVDDLDKHEGGIDLDNASSVTIDSSNNTGDNKCVEETNEEASSSDEERNDDNNKEDEKIERDSSKCIVTDIEEM